MKAILRNIWKNKFSTTSKICGLIVGYSAFIFLVENINYETSYDQFWSNYQSIYRLTLNLRYADGEEMQSARNFPGSSELLHAELTDLLTYCNYTKDRVTVFNGPQKKIQDVNFVWSDPTFFEVFDSKISRNESSALLENLHGIVISQSLAHQLFGGENPLNQEITLNEGWNFIVEGVFEDIPENSHMRIDMIAPYKSLFYYMRNFDNERQVLVDDPNFKFSVAAPYSKNRWTTRAQNRPYCYLKLNPNVSIEAISNKVDDLLEKVSLPHDLRDADLSFGLQPIASIHLTSNLEHELVENGNSQRVFLLSIISFVLLLICLTNFINLNTITAAENLKNYMIRMIHGATKRQIFRIVWLESFLFNFAAVLVSWLIAYVLIRMQFSISTISYSTCLLVISISMFISFIAALLPFIMILKDHLFSSFNEKKLNLKLHWMSQKVMITSQFSIAILLIICTLGIYRQMGYMTDKQLGFNGDQTVYCYTPMSMNQHPDLLSKLTSFRNEVLALGSVRSFSASSSIPAKSVNRLNSYVRASDSAEPYNTSFSEISIDNAYLNTYNIALLAGANLDYKGNWMSDQILINATAAKKMGIANPHLAIGKTISLPKKKYQIKGVIEDYHHTSLHSAIKPTIYTQSLKWDQAVGYYSFKLNASNITGATGQISKIWSQLYPKEEFTFNFSNQSFQEQYEADQRFSQLLNTSTLLALFISCMGLLGVVLFNTRQRLKEIGIRKVFGASLTEILVLLNKDFMLWIAVAFVIASPLAFYVMSKWLENFAYRINIAWWIFVLAGFFTMLLALISISWRAYSAAISNPINALRHE